MTVQNYLPQKKSHFLTWLINLFLLKTQIVEEIYNEDETMPVRTPEEQLCSSA